MYMDMGQLVGRDGNLVGMIELPELKFSYGAVEKALAIAYGCSRGRSSGWFSQYGRKFTEARRARARQPRWPGRASRLLAGPDAPLRLGARILRVGPPPATAVSLIESHWKAELKPIVDAAARGLVHNEPGDADVILFLGGVGLRTGSLRGEAGPSIPIIDRSSLGKLPAAMARWMTVTPKDPAPRGLIVNISERLRVFHSALAVTYMDELDAERRAALAGDEPQPKARKPPRRRARAGAGGPSRQRGGA